MELSINRGPSLVLVEYTEQEIVLFIPEIMKKYLKDLKIAF